MSQVDPIETRRVTRDEAIKWMHDRLGRTVEVAVYVELPDGDSTKPFSYRGRLDPNNERRARLAGMYWLVTHREGGGTPGSLYFWDIEQLEISTAEAFNASGDLDLLTVKLGPGVRLELTCPAEDGSATPPPP